MVMSVITLTTPVYKAITSLTFNNTYHSDDRVRNDVQIRQSVKECLL